MTERAFAEAARAALLRQEERGRYRRRRRVAPLPSRDPNTLCVDGRRCVAFCSNDYLGLRNHPEVVAAFKRAADHYGAGSGAAQLLSGYTEEHQRLEEELAEFLGVERCVLFSSGYMANLGVLSALAGRGDRIIEDRLNHASLIDAARLSGAQVWRYRHADPAALEARLAAAGDARCLVVTDALFSMDGDLAPLPRLADLCRAYGAWLMVDDAHGFGVLGPEGRGSLEHFGLDSAQVPILVVTLGKALGSFGAVVAGSAPLAETLIQKARTFIYTTSPPAALAAAARSALGILRHQPELRRRLAANIACFRRSACAAGLQLGPNDNAIQILPVGDDHDTADLGERLLDRGYWVGAIRPPTVPEGTARLRITLSASHDESQIEGLVAALASVLV
jgi:8-amino-7-oxononanoate synthase